MPIAHERACQDRFYAEGTEGAKGGESQISLKALKEPATHNRIKREISIAQSVVHPLRAIHPSIRQLVVQHSCHLVDVGRHQVKLRVMVEESRLFVL